MTIELLDAAKRAGKHNEFFEASRILNLDKIVVAHYLIKSAFEVNPGESQRINNYLQKFLE